MTEHLIVETLNFVLNTLFYVFHSGRVTRKHYGGNSLRPDFVKNEAREEVDLNEAQPRGEEYNEIRTFIHTKI